MNRLRSVVRNVLSRLLVGTMFYLSALRLCIESPWPIRLIGLWALLVAPFTFLQRIAADLGGEIGLIWLLLPIILAGFIPFDSPQRK